MDKINLQKILHDAAKVVKEASNLILNKENNGRRIRQDERRDVKINADGFLDQFLIRKIGELAPFQMLTEESGLLNSGQKTDNYIWIIDPLDGSLNYSRGIPMACISLALWQDGEPILGIIYDFIRDELFTGIVGVGAWLNGLPISVSNIEKKSQAVMCTGFPVSTDFSEPALVDFIGKIIGYKKVRLFGTAALSLAYVACGRADVYEEKDIKLWDVAAGVALVKAAGGVIELNYTDPGNNAVHLIGMNNKFRLC